MRTSAGWFASRQDGPRADAGGAVRGRRDGQHADLGGRARAL